MNIVCRKAVPSFIYSRAVTAVKEGQSRKTSKFGHLTKTVGKHWRLLSKDGGNTWHLMSHSEYDTAVSKRH